MTSIVMKHYLQNIRNKDELEDCAEHADVVDQETYEDAKKKLVLNNLDN